MRLIYGLAVGFAVVIPAFGQVPGWMGAVDAGAAETINDTKLTGQPNELHVSTVPPASFWSPATRPAAATPYLPHH